MDRTPYVTRELYVASSGKLYGRTSLVITTNLSFAEWGNVIVNAKMMAALLERQLPF